MPTRSILACILGLTAAALAGCSGKSGGSATPLPEPPVRNGTPLGLQLVTTEARMKRFPVRTLAPFEHAVDLQFLHVVGEPPAIDSSRAHTGTASLALKPGTREVSIRLSSLLSGTAWPGRWTLLGAYLYSHQPQRLRAVYDIEGIDALTSEVELPAGQWTPILLDISSLQGEAARRLGSLRISFGSGLPQNVWIDNLVLIDNATRKVPADDAPAPAGAWTVSERGFSHIVERAGAFTERLPMPESDPKGWTLQEANPLRARFTSNGPIKQRVIYSDGRQYVDSRYEPLGGRIEAVDAPIERQHARPAEIQVKGTSARVNRTHPGDKNNDGYAESLGAYQLIASGPRIEFVLLPHEQIPVTTPIVEISGLPAGEVFAQADGTLLDRVARLENGNVLLQLPGTIARTVTVSVRIKQ